MLHWLTQYLHPGKTSAGGGYWFWSGMGPLPFMWLATVVIWYRHHNCHVKGCPWPGHPDPETGLPKCRRHHPGVKHNG